MQQIDVAKVSNNVPVVKLLAAPTLRRSAAYWTRGAPNPPSSRATRGPGTAVTKRPGASGTTVFRRSTVGPALRSGRPIELLPSSMYGPVSASFLSYAVAIVWAWSA
jgi:hypothetical protein